MDGKDVDEDNLNVQMRRKLNETSEIEGKIIQLIVFNLGDEEFGADIAQVREIIKTGSITPIPNSQDFIEGLTNIRGEISIVIDLKKLFFLKIKKEVKEKHIIITEQNKNLFGLKVDEVTEVLRINEKEIKATPGLISKIDKIYIRGILTIENRIIIILDLEKVLSEGELIKLSKIIEKHRGIAEEKDRKIEERKVKVAEEKVQNEEPGTK